MLRKHFTGMLCHTDRNTAVQSHKAVTAYFSSKQLLPFGFARQNSNWGKHKFHNHNPPPVKELVNIQ